MFIAKLLHRLYKTLLSPLFGERCRFYPSCSDYALEALQKRGFLIGGFLSLKRVIRCNPWCSGGHDPVPQGADRK